MVHYGWFRCCAVKHLHNRFNSTWNPGSIESLAPDQSRRCPHRIKSDLPAFGNQELGAPVFWREILPDPTNGARTTDLDPLVNDTHFDSSRSVDFIALFDVQPFTMRCEPACY